MVEYLDGIVVSGSSSSPITFSMPDDYKRGDYTPDLTGFQVYTTSNFTYEVQHFDQTWKVLSSGSHTSISGWNTVRFANPIDTNLKTQFRIIITELTGSIRYRVLSAIADTGVDVFGNTVRTVISRKSSNGISNDNAFWLSKANPSRFAVESLYFDNGSETTIDRIIVDPLTPGITMSIYYSNDTDQSNWDYKLWKRVPSIYHLSFKREIALPKPISARFLKLEFSALQARPYHPGSFSTKVRYNKHPKWVLDYFLMDLERQRMEEMIPSSVNVIQDAYALAYSYYLDDYQTLLPNELGKTENLSVFLQRNDLIEYVDPEMFSKIKVVMQPYMSNSNISRSLLGSALQSSYRTKFDSSLNIAPTVVKEYFAQASGGILTDVSTLNRESVMQELKYPPMFFFINCRHQYRIAEATFRDHKAYFAGIRSVKILRDQYASNKSFRTYNETFGDSVNIEINDFSS